MYNMSEMTLSTDKPMKVPRLYFENATKPLIVKSSIGMYSAFMKIVNAQPIIFLKSFYAYSSFMIFFLDIVIMKHSDAISRR
jgi:hypothetical protein